MCNAQHAACQRSGAGNIRRPNASIEPSPFPPSRRRTSTKMNKLRTYLKIIKTLGVAAVIASMAGCSKGSEDRTSKVHAGNEPEARAGKVVVDFRQSTVKQFYEHRAKGEFDEAFEMFGGPYRAFYGKPEWIAAMREIDIAVGRFKRADTASWAPRKSVRVEYAMLSADERLFVSEVSPHRIDGFFIIEDNNEESEPRAPISQGEPITNPADSLIFDKLTEDIANNQPAGLINRMKIQRITGESTRWHLLAGQKGLTLLHFAALRGATDSASELIGLGTPVDVVADHDSTPLFLAACAGHLDTVELLVSRGANVSHKNDMRLMPKDCAKMRGSSEVAAWLDSHHVEVRASPFEPLWRLDVKAKAEHTRICEAISLDMRSVPIAAQTISQIRTILGSDAFASDDDCFVIDVGPPDSAFHQMNAFVRGERGRGKVVGNLLTLAASVGNAEIVEQAIIHGFDSNLATYSYWDINGSRKSGPAILLAAQMGHEEIVRLLLKNGSRVDGIDTGSMQRAIDYAEVPAIRRMLLDATSAGER